MVQFIATLLLKKHMALNTVKFLKPKTLTAVYWLQLTVSWKMAKHMKNPKFHNPNQIN